MLKLNPKILEKEGKEEFAVLPHEEFEQHSRELEDYEDLKGLRAAKSEENDAPTTSLGEVRAELGL
jgi:PHD/YefM family antitoxin component YafN of YafNO toxin-antitoxin module